MEATPQEINRVALELHRQHRYLLIGVKDLETVYWYTQSTTGEHWHGTPDDALQAASKEPPTDVDLEG